MILHEIQMKPKCSQISFHISLLKAEAASKGADTNKKWREEHREIDFKFCFYLFNQNIISFLQLLLFPSFHFLSYPSFYFYFYYNYFYILNINQQQRIVTHFILIENKNIFVKRISAAPHQKQKKTAKNKIRL